MITQIEVNNFCNHKCWYCQVAHYKAPKPKVMPIILFEKILDQLRINFDKSTLNVVSFATYNEPTLDPYFKERLRLLTKKGFYYWFISNGSNISKDIVGFLIKEKILLTNFHINLPAIDTDQYMQITKNESNNIYKIRKQLIYLLENKDKLNVPINIVVHGDMSNIHKDNFNRVKDFFGCYDVEVSMSGVMDRAGMLKGFIQNSVDHGKDINLECSVKYFDNIYIGVDGNIFLCCHDYFQHTTYGNLNEKTLKELLNSKEHIKAISKCKKDFCRYCVFAQVT